jgi:hypothetical protein
MKYLLIVAGLLWTAQAYSQEIVVVEKKGIAYALVTSCTTTSRPTAVRVGKPEKGSTVVMKTRKKTQKCEVKKAVRLT